MTKRTTLIMLLAICLTAAAACAESVVRELPDDLVDAGEEITVVLTQDGIFLNTTIVTEILPDGFEYVDGSYTGSKTPDYYIGSNTLVMELAGNDELTESYNVKAGTLKQIGAAEFSGTYSYVNESLAILEGPVTGDSTLTPVEQVLPTHDPNGDGMITLADAAIALQMSVRGEFSEAADADDNGCVNALDALMFMQAAADNITI